MSDTFCPIPWNFQAIRSNGDLRVCCQANLSQGQGVLRHKNGQPFNAERDNLEDARNSSLLKQVRRNMLQGTWSETCTRCRQEESSGLNSRRVYENERWPLTLEEAKEWTDENGSIQQEKLPVVFYDLRFGNLCNLKCRMCGPTDSSAWYEDWVQLHGSNIFTDTSGPIAINEYKGRFKTSAYDWHLSDSFWQQIEKNLSNIQHIYMAGGEPLLIRRHYDFLQACIDRGFSKKISLEYNTNLTKLPEKVLHLWSDFKSVYVGASIDGLESIFEYQRFPAKWSEVLQNIYLLNQQPQNILSWFAYTITAYNIFHLTEFMMWKLSESGLNNINRTRKRPIITPHIAHNPKHLNIRVLPDPLKQLVVKRFDKFNTWIDSGDFNKDIRDQAQAITKSVLNYIQSESYYDDYWNEFCDYTKKLDNIRKQNLVESIPEFRGYIQNGSV